MSTLKWLAQKSTITSCSCRSDRAARISLACCSSAIDRIAWRSASAPEVGDLAGLASATLALGQVIRGHPAVAAFAAALLSCRHRALHAVACSASFRSMPDRIFMSSALPAAACIFEKEFDLLVVRMPAAVSN